MITQEIIPGFRADLQAIIKKYPELEHLMLAGVIFLGLDDNEAVALNRGVQASPERTLELAILKMRDDVSSDRLHGSARPMESLGLAYIQNDNVSSEFGAKGEPDKIGDRHNYPHSTQVFIDRERARMHQGDD
jgi:hypothetical protein